MKFRRVRPTSSYEILLPSNICEQFDYRVSSFWLDGDPLLLQLSSYIREKDGQLDARSRLAARIEKQKGEWAILSGDFLSDSTADQAVGQFIDNQGMMWIHIYIVWPHLTIYGTISGPRQFLQDKNENWALESLRSLRLVLQ